MVLPLFSLLTILSSLGGETKTPEPCGLWHLNGNAEDSSKKANPTEATGVSWGEGRYGLGLWLYGEKDCYLLVRHKGRLDATKALTLGLWVKLGGSGGCVAGKLEKPESTSYGIFFDSDERSLVFQVKALGEVVKVRSGPVDGDWHYVALTYDGDVIRGYIDGKLAGSEDAPGEIGSEKEEEDSVLKGGGDLEGPEVKDAAAGPSKNDSPMDGEAFFIGGHGFRGEIDEVRIHRAVLTQEQLIACANDGGPLPCRLEVTVCDESAKPLAARVYVTTSDGQRHGPRDTFFYPRADHRFYSDGRFKLDLLPGKASMTVCRGPQYEAKDVDVDLKPGKNEVCTVLKRLMDLGARGWHGGDGQIQCAGHGEKDEYWGHFPHLGKKGGLNLMIALTTVACKAEGYDWVPSDYARDGLRGIGMGEYFTQFNGHLDFIFDPDSKLEAQRNEIMGPGGSEAMSCGPFFHILRYEILAENGAVAYPAHPYMGPFGNPFVGSGWGHNRERVMDFALGRGHVVGAGMLEEATKFLNLGFRISFQGETDAYMNWDPGAGAVTTYVHAPELTAGSLVRGILDGKTVVSYGGPFVLLEVNGKGIGETVTLQGKAEETVQAQVEACFWPGLEKLELMKQGQVITAIPGNGERVVKKTLAIPIKETCWLMAKAYGKANKLFGTFAHTGPVYVRFGDSPVKVQDSDADYFLDYLQRLRALFKDYCQRSTLDRFSAGTPQLTREKLLEQGIDPDAPMDEKEVAFYNKLIDKSEEVFRSIQEGKGPNFSKEWWVWIEELDDRGENQLQREGERK